MEDELVAYVDVGINSMVVRRKDSATRLSYGLRTGHTEVAGNIHCIETVTAAAFQLLKFGAEHLKKTQSGERNVYYGQVSA